MKIVSRIKARKSDTRRVEVLGTVHAFVKQPDGEFVAEVANAAAQKVFLASRHFHELGAKPVLTAPGAGAPVNGTDPDATNPAPGTDGAPDDPVQAEAAALIDNSAAEIGRAIGNVSGLDVVRAAIDLEHADKDRVTVVKLLTDTLESAKQAGVE